ncbi:unnamed protein product [Cylindrotheca closterium]|uniref:Helicase-associated domain-containing protein n=1 Tax=Cylindrotheca closterium TaxID=2856 RepID=A0AAD2CDR6_9STRA|nr:unnamed protein product [Cylindrotheca closterium]
MSFTDINHKRRNHSHSYPSLSDDGPLSLIDSFLPSFEMTVPYSSFVSPLPLSFTDPFDDINMEPLPIRSQDQPSSMAHSSFDGFTSPFTQLDEPLGANLHKGLIDILNPVIDIVGCKRSPEDGSSNNSQRPYKRQRMNPVQSAHREENAARFRPYQEKQWREQFQKLIQYKLLHGHCCVPHSYQEDPILARWVKRQRYQYKKFHDSNPTSTMTTRRIQELESIGFIWHSHSSAWQEKLNELRIFKQQRGHCNVPSHYPENPALSTWVKCQRRQYKLYMTGSSSSTMTMERFQLLQSVGFVFDIQNVRRRSAAASY